MTFNASYTELFSTIIYDFQSLSNVLKHKEPHLRYGRKYVLSSKPLHLVNAPYIYP